ncbi:MAG: hypothetical protein E7397_03565 [Ruminococcaceae bacterium]|nr:hypothetical protein [Oscillospiraceae bacterium]
MRKFILGTDWWTDCDDVVAMRLLLRAHKKGEVELKGVAVNACMEYSVASVDGFLNQEGVSDIPIGIDLRATDFGGNPPYQKGLAPFAKRYCRNEDAEDACRLYRRILAEAREPIEIVEIGFLQVMEQLLKSEKDDISPKSGMELVQENVEKIWVMAGKWDEDGGVEHNFANTDTARNAAEYFCRCCPVPVTFLGFEVGETVITGDCLAQNDVLYQVLCDHGSQNGRMSWDPMLVHVALIGDEELAGYQKVSGTASVEKLTGKNHFIMSDAGRHCYLIKRREDDYYKKMINDLIG